MILYGMQSSVMGWYAFGSSEDLFGFRRVMTLARRHTLGHLNEWRHTVQKDWSHSVALLPWCCMNSGWMLSILGVLPGLGCLIADAISLWLTSALGAQRR